MPSNSNKWITPAEAAQKSLAVRASLDAQRFAKESGEKTKQCAFEDAPVTDAERQRVNDLVQQAVEKGTRSSSTCWDVSRLKKAATEMGFSTRIYQARDMSDEMVDYLDIEF